MEGAGNSVSLTLAYAYDDWYISTCVYKIKVAMVLFHNLNKPIESSWKRLCLFCSSHCQMLMEKLGFTV